MKVRTNAERHLKNVFGSETVYLKCKNASRKNANTPRRLLLKLLNKFLITSIGSIKRYNILYRSAGLTHGSWRALDK